MGDEPETSRTASPTPKPICPKCFTPISGSENFCRTCGLPLTLLGPFEQVRAIGDAYRVATDTPRKPIVVVGMWIIFGPPLFFFLAFGVYCLADIREVIASIRSSDDLVRFLFLVAMFSGLAFICVRMLYKTTRSYLRLRNESHDLD
jgi:hypothetical protein